MFFLLPHPRTVDSLHRHWEVYRDTVYSLRTAAISRSARQLTGHVILICDVTSYITKNGVKLAKTDVENVDAESKTEPVDGE